MIQTDSHLAPGWLFYCRNCGKIESPPKSLTPVEYEKALIRMRAEDMGAMCDWAEEVGKGNIEKAVFIVESWVEAHPERSDE